MCYLCGTKPSKTIAAALRVWSRKKCGPECACWGNSHEPKQCQARVFRANNDCGSATTNPIGWDKKPTRAKRWTARDFDKYQQRTRYNPL